MDDGGAGCMMLRNACRPPGISSCRPANKQIVWKNVIVWITRLSSWSREYLLQFNQYQPMSEYTDCDIVCTGSQSLVSALHQ